MPDLLFLDTETGGFDPQVDALLEVGLVHVRDGVIVAQAEFSVRSEGRRVLAEATKVNGIDVFLHDHEVVTQTRDQAVQSIDFWLHEHFGPHPDRVAIPIGHNYPFDRGFLLELFGAEAYAALFSHRYRDTLQALRFLADAGRFNGRMTRLDDVCRALGIYRARTHRALDDALATVEVHAWIMDTLAGL